MNYYSLILKRGENYILAPSRVLPAQSIDEVVLLPAPTLLSEKFLHFLFPHLLSRSLVYAEGPFCVVFASHLQAAS